MQEFVSSSAIVSKLSFRGAAGERLIAVSLFVAMSFIRVLHLVVYFNRIVSQS
jgi:hypothetical protein